MPRLSDSMEEGTVLKWMKSVGDQVELGEELVEIETDKANMVFEADAAGTLVEIVADEGATLPIGEVIARVGDASEAQDGGALAGTVTATAGRTRRTVLAPLRIVRRTLPTPPPPPSRPLRPTRKSRTTRLRLLPYPARRRWRSTGLRGGGEEGRRAGQGLPDRAPDRDREGRRPGDALRLGARGADHQGRRRAGGRRRRRRRQSPPPPRRLPRPRSPRPPRARSRSSS